MDLLGINAYAKHRGVTKTAVQNAIKNGKLDGSFTIIKNRKLIDPEKADELWEKNTVVNNKNAHTLNRNSEKKEEKPQEPQLKGPSYAQSRAIKEAYAAKMAQVNYEEKAGNLIDADEVKKAVRLIARTVRDSLMNIPDKLAPILTAETDMDEVHKILTDEVRNACEGLANGDIQFGEND